MALWQKHWWTEAAALHMSGLRMALWPNLEPALDLLLRCWMGIFHALGWLHAMLCMTVIFSFCPGHWACVQILCVTFSMCLCVCVDLSAFWICVCVYVSREIYSCEHAGFSSICGSGHEAWIAQWLRSRLQSEVAPIWIQTTQAQHQA